MTIRAMRLFKNKNGKRKKESKVTRWFRILLWRLFVKWKVRERIVIANSWANEHRGDTMLITVGCLLFSLILGAFLTLGSDQVSQVEEMARKGQMLKHELDSLVGLPYKTHDDSLKIVIKYKQLELIVNNLEKGQ